MNWRLLTMLSLFATVVLWGSASPRAADEAPSVQPPYAIAVVDYDSFFRNNRRYKAAIESLENETVQLEMEFKTEHELVHKLEEELKALRPGSTEFLNRREEATLKKHKLRARIELARAKIDERRVQVEVQFMGEIDKVIQQIAIANNMAVVLNQDSRVPPLRDLESTRQQRQRRVIYHDQVIDITPLVLNKI